MYASAISVAVAVFRHVDRLRDRARDERLDSLHHPDVAHVVNGAHAVLGLERAVKYREVLVLERGCSFDRLVLVHKLHDPSHLILPVAETPKRLRHRLVDDLEHSAAGELLVLHQSDVGLDAGGVAVHHEGDRSGGRDHGDLRVPVSVLDAERCSTLPTCCASPLMISSGT